MLHLFQCALAWGSKPPPPPPPPPPPLCLGVSCDPNAWYGGPLELYGVSIPMPYVYVIGLYLFLTILILDGGAGVDIFYPLLRPFMNRRTRGRFEPTPHYARLKSKYLVTS